ncbi:DUF2788 domain-containing protein [Eikenella sp. NML120348]|uniref:DUF2788 domain-containing protein n=1 Tax=Eikenella sp. NML120348 TaxID=1795831 RepID=UPI0007E03403|nr:DUF2788 domain-containing protein [Eikenella sp. NML120348]OAM40091.1 hypothetical protein A7P99_02580 [Eikenella sp. NML120348]
MTEAQLSAWGMKIGLSVLVIFIGLIIWDLGKKSGASKFSMAMPFFVLGLGMMGFLMKEVLVNLILKHSV